MPQTKELIQHLKNEGKELKEAWASDQFTDERSNAKAVGAALIMRNVLDHIESLGEEEKNG